MDKKKSIKNLVVILIAVVLLGLLWAFVKNQVTTTPIYIVVDTFVLIIPSIILIPGIICYIAYFFVNDAKIKSALKISSLCIAAFCVVFSVSFFAAVFVNSASEKTSSYKEAAESKYSLGNFVDLSDYEAERSDNELYSNGFLTVIILLIIILKATAAITIIQLPYMSIPAERRHRESLLRKGLKKNC